MPCGVFLYARWLLFWGRTSENTSYEYFIDRTSAGAQPNFREGRLIHQFLLPRNTARMFSVARLPSPWDRGCADYFACMRFYSG
jgi:hypothetical protein